MISIEQIKSWCEMHDIPAPVRSRNNRLRWTFKIVSREDGSDVRQSWERYAGDAGMRQSYRRSLPRVSHQPNALYIYKTTWNGYLRTYDVHLLFPQPTVIGVQ